MRIHFLCTLMGHVPGSLLWGKYKMRQYEKKKNTKKNIRTYVALHLIIIL